MAHADALDAVAAALSGARRALFITGAGISADSGLPTYRGVGGLYDDADTEDGVPIEVALSGPMFRRRPEVSWRHIRAIEAACRGAAPNAAHRFIAALQARLDVWVLTQNVDGLHEAAGSEQLVAIHGDVHHLSCTRCDWADTVADYAHLPALPTCPDCGAVIRPDVVLFGEMLPPRAVATLERELAHGFDIVFSIGTSSQFPYIVAPVVLLGREGAVTVEVNPGSTELSRRVDHKLAMGAAAAMTSVAERMGVALQSSSAGRSQAPASS